MLHEKVYKMIKNNNYQYFLCLNKSSSLIMSAYFITWKQAESGHAKCKHKDTKFPFSSSCSCEQVLCESWTQAAFTWKQLFQTAAVTREHVTCKAFTKCSIAYLCWCHCSCHFTRISCLCSCSCPCTYPSIIFALKNHISLTLPVRDAHRK